MALGFLERRTVHIYKEEKVSPDLVEEALRTALYAPNHLHTKPWSFIWLGNEMREKVAELAISVKADSSDVIKKSIHKKFMTPSDLIVILCKVSSDEQRFLEDYASVACGVQNISLFLWEKKIGTKWSTGQVTRHEKLYKLLEIDPNIYRSVGFLWIGAAKIVPPCPPKASLDEVLKVTK